MASRDFANEVVSLIMILLVHFGKVPVASSTGRYFVHQSVHLDLDQVVLLLSLRNHAPIHDVAMVSNYCCVSSQVDTQTGNPGRRGYSFPDLHPQDFDPLRSASFSKVSS